MEGNTYFINGFELYTDDLKEKYNDFLDEFEATLNSMDKLGVVISNIIKETGIEDYGFDMVCIVPRQSEPEQVCYLANKYIKKDNEGENEISVESFKELIKNYEATSIDIKINKLGILLNKKLNKFAIDGDDLFSDYKMSMVVTDRY
jgi:hypothetical protein